VNNIKLDYRLVIGFSELKEKPFSLFTRDHREMEDIRRGMRAMCGGWHDDTTRILLEYNRVLFTSLIRVNRIKKKGIITAVSFDISVWEPVRQIIIGEAHARMKHNYWLDLPFPKDNLVGLEAILRNYVNKLEIPCTICSNPTNMSSVTFYPFAGGACPKCKEAGKIPNIKTN